jgi:uncharacterized protein YbjT (DUF2867 family)
MRILVSGATGMVGELLLARLCASPKVDVITTIGRRASQLSSEKLVQLEGPVEAWPSLIEGGAFDVAISSLGTTIRDAGSQGAFAAIDHDALLSFARSARACGARHFLMVSSVGAHAASRNFYLSTKGRAEASVANVGFERLDILRPGLLRGVRKGAPRFGERLAMMFSPVQDLLTPHVLSRYRSTPAQSVAASLVNLMREEQRGIFIHHNDEMAALAKAVAS